MRHFRRRQRANERLDALLRDISSVRLTLDTDLTVAAAAAEADRFDLAAEIVDFDRAELVAFTERAFAELQAPDQQLAAVEARREKPKMVLHHRMAFAAAPAMLLAAAVIAVAGISNGGQAKKPSVSRPQLMASYTALTQLARSNANPDQLVEVGQQLNNSVAQLIAAAAHDPAKAQQAMRILWAEQVLLTRHHPNGGDTLLAQARALVLKLQQTVPSSVLTLAPAPAPVGTVSPPVLTVVVPTATASAPAEQPAAKPTPAPATHSPAPQPSQAPTPQPTTGDATVNPEPSPKPTPIDPWPFGGDTGFGGD